MKKILLLTITLIISPHAFASTFVGNGGSWLDPELSEALYRLEEILEDIKSKSDLEECQLSECDILENLNKQSVRIHPEFLLEEKSKNPQENP